MSEDSGPAMNATAAADAAGGAGDESRFRESVLITWVPDDWTLMQGAVFAGAESAKIPFPKWRRGTAAVPRTADSHRRLAAPM